MLSVPIALAFVAITIGPVTMPPSAIVSVPVPRLPTFTPELLLQVEPARGLPLSMHKTSSPACWRRPDGRCEDLLLAQRSILAAPTT
jgi:hypothetical protein